PGLGTLYVDPKTLPEGPFLAYDHQGKLVSTVYMIPLKDIDAHKKVENLKAPGGKVVSVDMYYNAGHPGVEEPHYHIVLWHLANDSHSLRIPTSAQPWASDYLVDPGDRFEVVLTVPGVYDYFCTPHEMAGMVGRIIVGQPSGPGTLPFDYFKGDASKASWKEV